RFPKNVKKVTVRIIGDTRVISPVKKKIIGEKISTSEILVNEMIEKRDKSKLLELARMQIYYGSHMLAINCSERSRTEAEDMEWVFRTIQNEIEIPLCVDSVNADVQEAGLKFHKHGRSLLNSVTADRKRMADNFPLVKKYNAQVVAMLEGETGIGKDIDSHLKEIPEILAVAEEYGILQEDIFIDCMVFPLSIDWTHAQCYLQAITRVKTDFPRVKTICGLNNMSFGLPQVDLIDQAFIVMCAAAGQDAVLIDLKKETGAMLRTVKALQGEDPYCMEYIEAFRRQDLNIFKEF
ncbi:MAG: dihydropteroate synthase, partial [Spirochaetales bacterium]|nr:dihydropteroate synthase [Spirochaetales bacterium]